MSRFDPLNAKYFRPLANAERLSDCLFYGGAVLSVLTLFVSESSTIYPWAFVLFFVDVVGLFIVSIAIRLYFHPRAARSRIKDFVAVACNVRVTPEVSDGYYNNDLSDPMQRVAAQVLESTLHSSEVLRRMLLWERLKVAALILLWLGWLTLGRHRFEVVIAVSQVLFSEQVLSKYFRTEALYRWCETVHEFTYRLIQAKSKTGEMTDVALEVFARYEADKAFAALTFSERIFKRINPEVSKLWEVEKAALGL